MKAYYLIKVVLFLTIATCSLSCRKFVEVAPPETTLISKTVFKEDVTANAAMASVYALMNTSGFSSGNTGSITYLSGLSSDELQLFSTQVVQVQFSTNSLQPTNSLSGSLWSSAYATIYRANAILEGIAASNTLTEGLKKDLEGEAKFIRAFSFFYLINLYGDVPLTLSTDYTVNRIMPRTSKQDVYKQIVQDLKDAQVLLPDNYSFASGERVRPNAWAATAMLARVYLYLGDWVNAEIETTKVIQVNALYELQPLSNVFLKNSKEAIWQLNNNTLNTNESTTFIFATRPANGALPESFYKSFDLNDQRKTSWIIVKTSAGITYYQPNKYKAARTPPVTNPVTQPVEYAMVMRLAEQYLIRAEARIQQNKVVDGIADLNLLRTRASLASPNQLIPLSTSLSKENALLATERERFFELFAEWGHRWLDLKRTGRADAVLAPLKATNWQSIDQLYPIPQEQIANNPAMRDAQNPGYQ